jgi:3-methylcrotonyl-CoA carboxylase alpha subunit
MPGRVLAVLVKAGDAVERGAPLIVMEAMKMEHTIVAPAASVVDKLLCAVGEQVREGAELLILSAQ